MGAAVDDVHQRHRQHMRARAADIAVERQARLLRRRLRDRERDAEDGVGAEAALVGRAVELDHRAVDAELIVGVAARERVEDLAVDRVDGLADALAAVALLVAVAQLDRLVGAGRSARGNRRAADDAGVQRHVDLDGRIAAAVEDLAGVDVGDRSHGRLRVLNDGNAARH